MIEVPFGGLGSGSADWLYTTNVPSQVVVASQGRALRVALSAGGADVVEEDMVAGSFPVVLPNGKLVGANGQIRGFSLAGGAALALTEEAETEPETGAGAGTPWAALRRIPFGQLSEQHFHQSTLSSFTTLEPGRGGTRETAYRQAPALVQWKLEETASVPAGDKGAGAVGKQPAGKLVSSSPFLGNREVVVNHGDFLRWMRPTGNTMATVSEAVIPGSAVVDEQNQVVAFAASGERYDLLWLDLATRKTVRVRLPDAGAPVQPPVVLPGRVVVVFEDSVVNFSHRSEDWTALLYPTTRKASVGRVGSGGQSKLAGPGAGDWDFPQNLAPMATATQDGRLVVRFRSYLSVIGPNGHLERAMAFPSAITSNPVVLFNGGICAASSSVLKCAVPSEMMCPHFQCPPCPPRALCSPCRVPPGCRSNPRVLWHER